MNRADKMDRMALLRPGVNAGPSTALGGKPDESGLMLQRSHTEPMQFRNVLSVNILRLFERY